MDATVSPSIPDLKDAPFRIRDQVDIPSLDSVRLRHIQLETQELAEECKALVASGSADFSQLAATLSTCSVSKDQGGDLGWIKVDNVGSDVSIVPLELRNSAIHMNKNDLAVVSSRGHDSQGKTVHRWHLLQVFDAMSKLSLTIERRRKENFHILKPIHNDPKFYLETMGCQMNTADSERMAAQLAILGYQRTEKSSEANVVVLNTCAIRDHAEQKVYSYLGPHIARKKHGDDVAVLVAGCVAQQEGEKILRRFPEVDAVFGPQYSNRVQDLLSKVYEGHQLVATDPAIQTEDSFPAIRNSDITAYVNVIYGCNERCTYCVVPNTRGVEQSRSKDAIVQEVTDLIAAGYKEVTLLGQNIDSWGRDMNPKQRFADLLAAVAEVPGLQRLRFLTSHPKYMSRRVIETVARYPQVIMPCFNVPFQSGSNEVLKQMRRGYTRERYLEIVRNIRSLCPDAAITADCIVGFPGETEEQFQETLTLMEEVSLLWCCCCYWSLGHIVYRK